MREIRVLLVLILTMIMVIGGCATSSSSSAHKSDAGRVLVSIPMGGVDAGEEEKKEER